MVKRHTLIWASGMALGLAASGYAGKTALDGRKQQLQHERSVASMVAHFRSCPETYLASGECYLPSQRAVIEREANEAKAAGRFREAGVAFAKIGKTAEARVMAGWCTNPKDRKAVLEEIKLREEANETITKAGGIPLAALSAPAAVISVRIPPGQAAPSSVPAAPGSAAAVPGASAAPVQGQAAAPAAGAPAEVPAAAAVQAEEAPAVQVYTTRTNPTELDGQLRGVALQAGRGDAFSKVTAIFDRLHVGGAQAVKVYDRASEMPRTASEAFAQGGDCTDLANIVIGLFRDMGIPGGAMVIHVDGAPENTDHMVPFALIGGKKIIVDLQERTLGQTAGGKRYGVLFTLTYDQAPFMYFREAGDYFMSQGKTPQAIAAYRRAAEFFPSDGYTHHNIGVLLERKGDMAGSATALKRAGDLDPRYRKAETRGSYNQEIQAAQAAYGRRDWKACIAHFNAALNSGEQLTPEDTSAINLNIDACTKNAGQ